MKRKKLITSFKNIYQLPLCKENHVGPRGVKKNHDIWSLSLVTSRSSWGEITYVKDNSKIQGV